MDSVGEVSSADTSVASLGVDAELRAGVVPLALVDVLALFPIGGGGAEPGPAGTVVSPVGEVPALVIAATVVILCGTRPLLVLVTSIFIRMITTVVHIIADFMGTDALLIGTFILCLVTDMEVRSAHGECFVRVVLRPIGGAIVEPIAETENVETESGELTSELERGLACRRHTGHVSFVALIPAIVIPIAHEFPWNAN